MKRAFLSLFLFQLLVSYSFSLEKADIIYTGGWFGLPYNIINDLPIGHVGVFAGFEKENNKIKAIIIDCVPDYFEPGGIRKVSWKKFTHNFSYPYYGNRTTPQKPTLEQRDKIISMAYKMLKPKAYSLTHYSQKGPKEFDCVGFVEYLYEKVGLNPTPDDQESGPGWPLTPSEQFYATVPGGEGNNFIQISFKYRKTSLEDLKIFETINKKYIINQNSIPIPKGFSIH